MKKYLVSIIELKKDGSLKPEIGFFATPYKWCRVVELSCSNKPFIIVDADTNAGAVRIGEMLFYNMALKKLKIAPKIKKEEISQQPFGAMIKQTIFSDYEKMKRFILIEALKRANWVQKDAAVMLGITPRKINYFVKQYKIKRAMSK